MFDFRILDTFVPIATWPDLEHSHCTHKCPGAPFRPQAFPFWKQSGRPTSCHHYFNLRYRIHHLPHCPSWHLSGHERQFCLQLPGIPHSRPPRRLPCSVSGWLGMRMGDIARFSPHPVNCCLETPLVPFPPRRGRLALEPLPPLSYGIHAPSPAPWWRHLAFPHPSSIPAILPYSFGSMPPLLLWVSPSSLALSAR